MRVFVPFARLRAETYIAMKDVAEFVPLVEDHDYGYYFKTRWDEKESFINVEHDIVPSVDKLQQMWDCPSQFCFCGYMYRIRLGVEYAFLGCVKIGKQIILDHPGLYDSIPQWTSCDGILSSAIGEDHTTHCYHGEVLHLHE